MSRILPLNKNEINYHLHIFVTFYRFLLCQTFKSWMNAL